MSDRLTVLQGDALAVLKTLPDESVQCCVTSPPYWGLRDYSACSCAQRRNAGIATLAEAGTVSDGVSGQCSATDERCKKDPDPDCPKCNGTGKIAGVAEHQIGLEKTPEEYIQKLVAVFREVKRVLRSDGVLWVNIGDSYNSIGHKKSNSGYGSTGLAGGIAQEHSPVYRENQAPGLKHKDMVGIPWMLAFALRADGWYLRSEIIWAKKNTMPESVTDRPTKSHEQIFLLAKSQTYFYDHVAILEPVSTSTHAHISQDLQNQIGTFRANGGGKTNGPLKPVFTKKTAINADGSKNNESFANGTCMPVAARNKRDVWFVGTQPYSEAHFATFNPDLIKPCVLAGTSARGCCPKCGSPWERLIEDGAPLEEWKKASGADGNGEYHGQNTKDYQAHLAQPASTVKERILKGMVEKKTVDWKPSCRCYPIEDTPDPVPCVVLDPFGGSGTTGEVALELGRHAVLIELNPEYISLCHDRTNITPGLPLA